MKRIFFSLAGLIAFTLASAQFRSVGVIVGAGYTMVDIEKAIEWSPLDEWDNIGVVFL